MKKIFITILAIIMLLSLCACSAGGSSKASPTSGGGGIASNTSDRGYEMPAPAAMAPRDEYASYEEGDYVAETEMDAVYNTSASVDGAGNVSEGRKLTFSASVSLNTKQYDADYLKIYSLIKNSGGYISNENSYDYSSQYGRTTGRETYISARIPAGDYDSFIDTVAAIGEVTQKSKYSQDLTSQYFDTEARIEMLELRKERLMAYLIEAKDAEAIVAFERELSDVLYELDSYQGNKRHLDQLVEFSTIDITLIELITPETIGKDGAPLGERASEAFGLSANNVGNFLKDAAVFFAAAAPVIALLAVIALIVWIVIRATRPLRKKLREARQKQQPYYAPYLQQQPGYQQPSQPQQTQTPPEPQTQTPPESPAPSEPEAPPTAQEKEPEDK